MTRSEALSADITALLRARKPILWIITREESRVESHLLSAAAAAGYVPRTWDAAAGVCDLSGSPLTNMGSADIGETLATIRERAKAGNRADRGAWILRDLTPWITGSIGIVTCRQVRNLARLLPTTPRDSAQALIVLTPDPNIPPELADLAAVINWPRPDREEIEKILDSTISSLPDEFQANAAPNGTRDAAIDAALGLTGEEATACYARSLVQFRRIDPNTVSQEKKRVVAREKVLEWYDPLPGGLDAVGGLDSLKSWLTLRARAYTPAARAYGLPSPKGILLVGVQGCGKSLTAKAIATAWRIPLLKVDLGALKSKFVGESEGNLRRALSVIEAIGRCVVWIDEIEKSLAGATQGAADGGVSSDALGTLLSWMQERASAAFVVATANDISALPPELLRKGRFDELWFVDLPNLEEREAILYTALRAYNRARITIDRVLIAEATSGFIGAEIAALVPEALFAAYADGAREITTEDLLAAARNTTPLSKTMGDKIAELRSKAQGRFRPATATFATLTAPSPSSRKIDL